VICSGNTDANLPCLFEYSKKAVILCTILDSSIRARNPGLAVRIGQLKSRGQGLVSQEPGSLTHSRYKTRGKRVGVSSFRKEGGNRKI